MHRGLFWQRGEEKKNRVYFLGRLIFGSCLGGQREEEKNREDWCRSRQNTLLAGSTMEQTLRLETRDTLSVSCVLGDEL